MTAPIGGSTVGSPAAGLTGGNGVLGKEEFLRLLVTQLKHQDPLNPMEGTQFATQLAQFSSLEQLITLNAKLDAQAGATAAGALTGQMGLAASLLGRTVVAEGSSMAVDGTGTAKVAVDLPGPAQTVTVRLRDSAGNEIARKDFNAVPGGRQTLTWRPDGVAPGTYSYDVEVTGRDGNAMTARPLVVGIVDGVFLERGQVVLRLGGATVRLDHLMEISPPDSPAA